MTQSGGDRVEDKTTTKTSAASEKPTEKRSFTDRKLPQFEEPGLRNVRSTNIFRAVNFELYVKPVKPCLYVTYFSSLINNSYLLLFSIVSMVMG